MEDQSQFYVHDIDPFLLKNEWISLPRYWVIYLFNFFLIYFWMRWWIHSGSLKRIAEKDLIDFMVFGWIGLFIGSRIFYVLFYNLEYFLAHPSQIPMFYKGGMSFHGAGIGVLISSWIVSKKKKLPVFQFLDSLVCIMPLCLGLGRIGNFINGELAGRPSYLPWAVIFPDFYDMTPRHPSQLYQALTEGFLLFLILQYLRPSQKIFSGKLSSYFLIGYGSFRFLVEFTRKPDPQLGFVIFNLTMGQILCSFMLFAGLGLFYIQQKWQREGR